MESNQIALVRSTWAKMVPIADKAADIFYTRLFEIDPSLRSLFKGNMTAQGKLLMDMINTAVEGLDDLDSIVPTVQDLGRRHGGYAVKPENYKTVASALLWTLRQGLGSDFTADVKDAWVETYTLLATVMQEAATEAQTVSTEEEGSQDALESPAPDEAVAEVPEQPQEPALQE